MRSYPYIQLSASKLKQVARDAKKAAEECREWIGDTYFEEALLEASYEYASAAFGESQYNERRGGGAEQWQTYREELEDQVRAILGVTEAAA